MKMPSAETTLYVYIKEKTIIVCDNGKEKTVFSDQGYVLTVYTFNINRSGYLDLTDLKRMMETLGAPQTHLGLKAMIAEVDEDGDGRLSFREFLLVYRKAQAGELSADSGLGQLAKLTEVDVDQVGVNGAKEFFEAKIEELNKKSKFEDEIRMEQEERKREEEGRAIRRQQFLEKASVFKC